jgi:regulatory subunit for Cdc7p protein kinase
MTAAFFASAGSASAPSVPVATPSSFFSSGRTPLPQSSSVSSSSARLRKTQSAVLDSTRSLRHNSLVQNPSPLLMHHLSATSSNSAPTLTSSSSSTKFVMVRDLETSVPPSMKEFPPTESRFATYPILNPDAPPGCSPFSLKLSSAYSYPPLRKYEREKKGEKETGNEAKRLKLELNTNGETPEEITKQSQTKTQQTPPASPFPSQNQISSSQDSFRTSNNSTLPSSTAPITSALSTTHSKQQQPNGATKRRLSRGVMLFEQAVATKTNAKTGHSHAHQEDRRKPTWCECCLVRVANYEAHLKGKGHQDFASNDSHYQQVDELFAQIAELQLWQMVSDSSDS